MSPDSVMPVWTPLVHLLSIAETPRSLRSQITSSKCSHPTFCSSAHPGRPVSDGLQGWQPDPYRRHELRYYSGGTATFLVRDGTVEGADPVDDVELPPPIEVHASAGPVIADTPRPPATPAAPAP